MAESSMTAPTAVHDLAVPTWKTPRAILLGLVPLVLLIGVMAAIFATDGGLGDRTAPFATSQKLLTLAPRAQLTAVEGLGHRRLLTDAAVMARVADWCRPA